jgi:gluconolactonase
MRRPRVLGLVLAVIDIASAQKLIHGVTIPAELTYLLPQSYTGNINKNFIDTKTSNASINAIFAAAQNATFYAYNKEFLSIIGSSPTIQTIPNTTFLYTNEAGVWVSTYNQVWFTGSGDDPKPYYILHLDNYTITPPNPHVTQPPPVLVGGDYHDGLVYFTGFGLKSTSLAPAIYSIDPSTGTSTTILDTYFGVPLNNIDDLTWVTANTSIGSTSCTHAGEDNLFFTILDVNARSETQFTDAVLPNAVFRFTPSTKSIQAVISRADILAPNGIHIDPTGRYLYVTDVAATALSGPGSNSSGSPAIYRYDLDVDCNPVNKRLFAIPRSGYADGIKVDRYGRVWTAEFNGVVVRNARGRELGVFNAEQLIDAVSFPISNFGLAGDKLVILAGDQVSVIQLGQNVTTPARTRNH